MEVKQETTGWRDDNLSARHRSWGVNCPATDLDLTLVEFNWRVPVAIIDYKHGNSKDSIRDIVRTDAVQAQLKLAEMANIAFAVVMYWRQPWQFKTYPGNEKARQWFKTGELLSELEFVRILHKIRNFELPDKVAANLNSEVA